MGAPFKGQARLAQRFYFNASPVQSNAIAFGNAESTPFSTGFPAGGA
jgi:predicted nucleotidyltransferase